MNGNRVVDGTNSTWDQFIPRKILGAFCSRSVDLHVGVIASPASTAIIAVVMSPNFFLQDISKQSDPMRAAVQ